MKKGLSKILSLACVFALLMTMALPAFAATAHKEYADVVAQANLATAVLKIDQVQGNLTADDVEEAVKAVAKDESAYFKKWLREEKDGPYLVDVVNGDSDTENIWGVFVNTGNKVRLHLFDLNKLAADGANLGQADAKAALKASLDKKGYATGWTEVYVNYADHTSAKVRYFFDAQGYLSVGTADGALLVRNVAGEYDQYLIGFNAGEAIDKDTYDERNTAAPAYGVYNRDYALVAPYVFCVFDEAVQSKGAVAGKTYYAKDGKAEIGLTGFNKTQPEYYQTRKTTGYIEMEAGLQEVPVQHYDSYAGATIDKTLRVYGWPASATGDHASAQILAGKDLPNAEYGKKYDDFASAYARFTYAMGTRADGTLVDVSLTSGGTAVTYLVTNGTSVIINDGTAAKNLIAKGNDGKIYLFNENGTVYQNSKTINGVKQGNSNVYKYDGQLVEWGVEKTVKLNGVDQRFYVPAAGEGQQASGTYDGFRVATNYYRYVPAVDGSETYEGITYYNSIGNSYLGWLSQSNGNFTTGRMYQTPITEHNVYILVAGPQLLADGVSPLDGTTKIAGGWYLFDKDGIQVRGTGDFYRFGKTFTLKNDVITLIDGNVIDSENVKVDLTK